MRALSHLAEPDPPPFDPEGAPAAGHSPSASPALADLYRRHSGWLLALLRLRYGREAAEDLLQETFLKAAASGQAATIRRPRAWLAAIALNAGRDRLRRRAARPPDSTPSEVEALDRLPAGATQDQALLLKQVILALPPHLKEVFLLSRFGGLTYDEIARRLDISVKTVEWRMSKALALCAETLRG